MMIACCIYQGLMCHPLRESRSSHLQVGNLVTQSRKQQFKIKFIFRARASTDDDNNPWQLFGRVLREEKIPLSPDQKQKLILVAAANASGLTAEEFDIKYRELLVLVPDLQPRVMRLLPKLLAELVKDTDGVASKLIQLKILFPSANIADMVVKRPSILLDQEFELVPAAAVKLRELFGEAVVDRMVETQPLLLVEDVTEILEELERLMPGADPRKVLAQDPDMLFAVQRGSKKLGPGAEFM